MRAHIRICRKKAAQTSDETALDCTRINAAARMNVCLTAKFMHGLKLANVDINRKMLAELAVNDKEGFATLAALAKEKLA